MIENLIDGEFLIFFLCVLMSDIPHDEFLVISETLPNTGVSINHTIEPIGPILYGL